jgi:hypothetical protein
VLIDLQSGTHQVPDAAEAAESAVVSAVG